MDTITARSPRHRPQSMRRPALRRVSIRPIEPSDADDLSDLYCSLSPESRRSRFLGLVSDEAIRAMARRLSDAPGLVAVVVERGPRDGALVGHIALLPTAPGRAELAIVVSDALQGRGIGTRLVRAATDEARRSGLRRLVASTFTDNTRMRRLLVHAGWPMERDVIDGCVEEIELVGG